MMQIRFKEDITVIEFNFCFAGELSKQEVDYKKNEILTVGSALSYGPPNQKMKTRPGKPGIRTTLLKVTLWDAERWEIIEQGYDLDSTSPGYFIIDQNLIEILPATASPNLGDDEPLAGHSNSGF